MTYMIKNFFQNLNSSPVRYLVISGQASVIYGAATFSEDIDLWVSPYEENWNILLKVLKKVDARVYKLTPPITMEFIKKGHGFHFELNLNNKKSSPLFLDTLGSVPRVNSFEKAWQNAVYVETDWGSIPVMGLRNLVEIKKTQRLGDYPVISNLVRIEYEKHERSKIDSKTWKWILTNSYDIDDMIYFLKNHKSAYNIASSIYRPCMSYCLKAIDKSTRRETYFKHASREIALEIEEIRQSDREYWKPIIKELKELNKKGQLLPVGSTVPLIV